MMSTDRPVFHVREIIQMRKDEVVSLPLVHSVVFDDGETLTNVLQNETIYSWLFWKIFRVYKNTRILPKHHVASVLKGNALNTDTHAKLCSAILKSIVADENLFYPQQKEPVLKLIYKTISDAMSELSLLSEANVTSIDILDFIQAAHHPTVTQLKDQAHQDHRAIKYAYEETVKLIRTSKDFEENGLAKAVKAEMVKTNQVVQCVVFRGFGSDVDGAIYSEPVWGNYTFGNTRFYDFVVDSRTAAKSHFYSDTALKDSEYMARKFRLFATVLERINYTDCGSTDHVLWEVKGEQRDSSGTVLYPGDLPFLIGKNYLDESTGGYLSIEGDERHLIGKKIKFRSLLHCKEPDPKAVCHMCAGRLSENISRFANLGHLGSVTTTKEITQNLLSIKHVNTSSTLIKILMGEHERKYLNTGTAGTAIYLNEPLKMLRPKLVVLRDEATGLIALNNVEDLEQITLSRISQVTVVKLIVEAHGVIQDTTLTVEQKSKPAMMSGDLIRYLKLKSWTIDEQNNFMIDMSGWDYRLPVFVMQNREESYVDLANQVNVMVQSSQKNLQKRQAKAAATLLLQELFDLVNSKLRVNILSFEIIIYALMVESKSSYALARGAMDPVLGVSELLTKYRSLGAAMAFEDQAETITDPANFYQGRRPDSPLDVFFAPNEVVRAYRNKHFTVN